MPHVLSFVQIWQIGVISSLQASVSFFIMLPLMVYQWYVNGLTAIILTKYIVAVDKVWTIDLGIGLDQSGVLPSAGKDYARFWCIFTVERRRCNTPKWIATSTNWQCRSLIVDNKSYNTARSTIISLTTSTTTYHFSRLFFFHLFLVAYQNMINIQPDQSSNHQTASYPLAHVLPECHYPICHQ